MPNRLSVSENHEDPKKIFRLHDRFLECHPSCCGLVFAFLPYSFPLTVNDMRLVPWVSTRDGNNTVAAIQFGFTTDAVYTTNYRVTVEVKIWLFRTINYTNIKVHILKNAIDYTFKYPLSEKADAAWINIANDGNPRCGRLDVLFPSTGAYGFYIAARENGEELKIVYVGVDKHIIDIKPYESRLSIEFNVRTLGIALVGTGVALLNLILRRQEDRQADSVGTPSDRRYPKRASRE
jgi:hypothetical protein